MTECALPTTGQQQDWRCKPACQRFGLLDRYRDIYELPSDYPLVTLDEGQTPLIPTPNLAQWLETHTGVAGLSIFCKYEGANPTGSFKDRGMTYAVSQAKADGATSLICASTGNTSAAAAAYGAKAGIPVLVIIPQGKVALGKLSQAMLYGATIVEIDGNFDQALTLVREMGETGRVTVVNSINPYRILGQMSGAFEIVDRLGRAPDYHFIPVGNAGNITAYWRGYKRYAELGRIQALPTMMGYEAEGSAAIVYNRIIENPETLATAIRIGNPASWAGAVEARDASGGTIGAVSDPDIVAAYQLLGTREGLFCEPASAASVAGLIQACQQGQVAPGSTITCTLTGNGLKDPDSAITYGKAKRVTLPATVEAMLSLID